MILATLLCAYKIGDLEVQRGDPSNLRSEKDSPTVLSPGQHLIPDTNYLDLAVLSTEGFDVISKRRIDKFLKPTHVAYRWDKSFRNEGYNWFLHTRPENHIKLRDTVKLDVDLESNVFLSSYVALQDRFFSALKDTHRITFTWPDRRWSSKLPRQEKSVVSKCLNKFPYKVGVSTSKTVNILVSKRQSWDRRGRKAIGWDVFLSNGPSGHETGIRRYQAIAGEFIECGKIDRLPEPYKP